MPVTDTSALTAVETGSRQEPPGLARLPEDLLAISNDYGIRAIARVVGLLFGILAITPWLTMWLSPWICVLSAPLLGAQIYKLTIVMHDCGHNTLFTSRRWNRLAGEFCGALLATDLTSFRRLHWQHHTNYGRSDDPQGRDYRDLQQASRSALVWHLLRPLVGYNLFKLIVFGKASKRQSDRLERKALLQMARKVLGIMAAQIIVAALATGFGQIWWLVFLYPVSAATFALFFSQTRGFVEHVAFPDSPSESFVRTHLPNWFDRIFFYDVNFNYHVEHHLYPNAPSCNLPAIHEFVRDKHHTEATLSTSVMKTIIGRLAAAPA